MTNKTLFDVVNAEVKTMGKALNTLMAFTRMVEETVNQIAEENEIELPLSLNAKEDLVIRKDVFGVSTKGRPALSERMSEELFNAVHQSVGKASLCWTDIDGAGTYNALRAGDIAFELCHMIADEIDAERDGACGYIETTTKRDCGSILRLSEVAVTDESEGDIR